MGSDRRKHREDHWEDHTSWRYQQAAQLRKGRGCAGPTGAAKGGETTQRVSPKSSSQAPSGQETCHQQPKEKELLPLHFKILQCSFIVFERTGLQPAQRTSDLRTDAVSRPCTTRCHLPLPGPNYRHATSAGTDPSGPCSFAAAAQKRKRKKELTPELHAEHPCPAQAGPPRSSQHGKALPAGRALPPPPSQRSDVKLRESKFGREVSQVPGGQGKATVCYKVFNANELYRKLTSLKPPTITKLYGR